ncbi:hypothetical protein POV27_07430 [Aureisphaera galaxeae]|uniref:hypothetical protein n=1 Tax=Aureisphaera galaxeae TaxID=1538023 RepID=UPI002350EF35|nr:hypothetical protein [Aureisphaera galaxeae]MDC8003878.1 hypothetical protein [Aureisphaera galaxeae]
MITIVLVIVVALFLVYFQVIKERDAAQTERKEIEGTIFYHEDDFGQIEIVPVENFDRLITEAQNVKDFAEKHFTGAGYSAMYEREETGLKLVDRKIEVSELTEILSKLSLEKHTKVTSGIRPNEFVSEHTVGYGENYNGLFFDRKDNIVSNIWIAGRLNADDNTTAAVLNEIGMKWDLLLMDWNSLELIDLKSKDQIKEYLE